MKRFALLFSILILLESFIEKDLYILFASKGNKTDYQSLVKEAEKADIILFGELHDNPVNHWLELKLLKDLYKVKGSKLIVGAEMFEADDQIVINEYLLKKISDKTLKEEIKTWNNYKTDYKPLLDFSKEYSLPFIATNIPRRYANMVYSKGFEALDSISPQAKSWIAPLPIFYSDTLRAYREIFKAAGGHGGSNLPKSQAIKDATMAHFINLNYKKGATFLHFHGSYHSNNYQGIYWYLKQLNPTLKILTIASVEQDEIEKLSQENLHLADFIICTPADLTKTY